LTFSLSRAAAEIHTLAVPAIAVIERNSDRDASRVSVD
jgi:hypothetical protein